VNDYSKDHKNNFDNLEISRNPMAFVTFLLYSFLNPVKIHEYSALCNCGPSAAKDKKQEDWNKLEDKIVSDFTLLCQNTSIPHGVPENDRDLTTILKRVLPYIVICIRTRKAGGQHVRKDIGSRSKTFILIWNLSFSRYTRGDYRLEVLKSGRWQTKDEASQRVKRTRNDEVLPMAERTTNDNVTPLGEDFDEEQVAKRVRANVGKAED
jgi:hypothetical protein